MNYIILGGTGFIGTHLANLLHAQCPDSKIWNLDIVNPIKLDAMQEKWEERRVKNDVAGVKSIDKEIQEYTTIKDWKSPVVDGETRKAEFVYCDVRKPIPSLPFEPTEDDIIFNLAAVHRTPGHPDFAYFEANIRGAENVCAFAEKYGIKKIVFTSSIAPYGAAEELKEETTLPTPNTPYGISKLTAEKIHLAWQAGGNRSFDGTQDDKGAKEEVKNERQLTIVRPGVVFGKGENGNFTRLYWGIKGHKFMYPGRKDTVKAAIYVKELVRFMVWCLDHQKSGAEIYNCTFEPAYTIEEICETIKKVTGMNNKIPFVPSWFLMSAASVIGALGAPMGICPARVKKLMISTNICGKKFANSGYQFKWSFEEAVTDWFNDNKRMWLK